MLSISHGSKTVSITGQVNPQDYDTCLDTANHALYHFKATNRNVWGCDGIGYYIEKAKGNIRVNTSSVGPRNYVRGLAELRLCERCKGVIG